jgi:hypothetical protein
MVIMGISGGLAGKIRTLACNRIFERLPEKLTLDVTREFFRGRYLCRVVAAKQGFVALDGLGTKARAFVLPIGSTVRLGFAQEEGWVELEGEVVGWAVGDAGGRVMVQCAATGRILQRRRFGRLQEELPVIYLAENDSQTNGLISDSYTQTGMTRNLSQTGMCIFFPFPLPERRILHLHLLAQGTTPLRFRGEVAWQIPSGDNAEGCLVGAHVSATSAKQQQRYRSLLNRLARKRAINASRKLRSQYEAGPSA